MSEMSGSQKINSLLGIKMYKKKVYRNLSRQINIGLGQYGRAWDCLESVWIEKHSGQGQST